MLERVVKNNFPAEHIKFALGYGSAVFKQANYDQQNRDQVIDMIFIVDDTLKFHEKNLNKNYKHYSYFAKRLPPGFTDGVVQNAGSNIYFNPLIPLSSLKGPGLEQDQRRIKYGVIGVEKAIADLTSWQTFAMAGRL